MASIRAIETQSVHRIQSGQVIVDLCSVVKELVENCLDAGATSIDVRFKNNGLDSIEVQDNGGGIRNEDFESLALKHHTSKLATYDDLTALSTFGFRGEALSSLCALSRFHVITARDGEAPKGTKLEFELSGRLKGSSVAASPKGTTVVVEEIFFNLPVRRQELRKNIKREYGKALTLLHAYACISTRVKIVVSNQMPKGKKQIMFSTAMNTNVRENIVNVYGSKTLQALVPLELKVCKDSLSGANINFEISGFISKPVHGEGRQTPDRQMFFVNARPCTLPQVARAFNEVYKSYNLSQSPFILADIKLDTNAYDVNVSPDKRIILLHNQTPLIDKMKEELTQLFQGETASRTQIPSNEIATLTRRTAAAGGSPLELHRDPRPQHNVSNANAVPHVVQDGVPVMATVTKRSSQSLFDDRHHNNLEGSLTRGFREHNLSESPDSSDLEQILEEQNREHSGTDGTSFQERLESSSAAREAAADDPQDIPHRDPEIASQVFVVEYDGTNGETKPKSTSNRLWSSYARPDTNADRESRFSASETAPSTKRRRIHIPKAYELSSVPTSGYKIAEERNRHDQMEFSSQQGRPATERDDETLGRTDSSPKSKSSSEAEIGTHAENSKDRLSLSPTPADLDDDYVDPSQRKLKEEMKVQEMIRHAEESFVRPSQKTQSRANLLLKNTSRNNSTVNVAFRLNTSISAIRKSFKILKTMTDNQCSLLRSEHDHAPHIADVGHSDRIAARDRRDQNLTAEERLSLTVSKSDFARMHVIGQFNLGFILALRPSTAASSPRNYSDDLLIIDQHASDEIYNFHRLSDTTTLTPQPLVRPHELELTAVEEETVIAHNSPGDILMRNGFQVFVDTSGDRPVGKRCSLLTLPTSRETVFDMRDLEELLVLLGDSSSTSATQTLRPSKVRKMLAMRACRSSTMIGKPLTHRGMRTIVRHLSEIEKPFSCPHGRPTLRHLACLDDWIAWRENHGFMNLYNGTEEDRS